jgi:PAS domain S-box-containing protein
MKRLLGDICFDIARYAADKNHTFLAHLLRIAALEASQNAALETIDASDLTPSNLVVGLWDWDVPNDVRHLDTAGANLFGYQGRATLTQTQLIERLHPDDVDEWRRKVFQATRIGGIYEHEYRIIRNDRVLWVRAKGQCTLDKSGRPERFPGAVIDITRLKQAH